MLKQSKKWCRNIGLLSIDYAFRPRLRSRLTLGGRAWPRNPSVFGDGDSHPIDRYSRQHPLFQNLQDSSRYPFTGGWNAPLPLQIHEVRSFGVQFKPRYIFGAGSLDQ